MHACFGCRQMGYPPTCCRQVVLLALPFCHACMHSFACMHLSLPCICHASVMHLSTACKQWHACIMSCHLPSAGLAICHACITTFYAFITTAHACITITRVCCCNECLHHHQSCWVFHCRRYGLWMWMMRPLLP